MSLGADRAQASQPQNSLPAMDLAVLSKEVTALKLSFTGERVISGMRSCI
jgi:hypothetical protein